MGPWRRKIGEGHTRRLPIRLRMQVDEVIHVDLIGADGQRIETMRETMTHFEQHALHREGQIERANALRIEPAAVDSRALARNRQEAPARIMRAIGDALPSHAKPPTAT